MSARTTARTPRTIPVRKGSFSFDEAPTYSCDGEPSLTHLLNALSVSFPDGERMFIDAVRHYRDRVDGKLAEDVKGFIAQEAIHSREHHQLNQLIDRNKYPVTENRSGHSGAHRVLALARADAHVAVN